MSILYYSILKRRTDNLWIDPLEQPREWPGCGSQSQCAHKSPRDRAREGKMIIVIFQLQFARAIGKEEVTNPISEDIMRSLDIERFLNLGIWSADEMDEDQSRDQCRNDYVYREVQLFRYCRRGCRRRMGHTYQLSHVVDRQKRRRSLYNSLVTWNILPPRAAEKARTTFAKATSPLRHFSG